MDTLMIVEDEKEVRKSLITLVKKSGVPVRKILECCNGQEALVRLEECAVDLVFTDIHMPEMDGCALAGEIASREYAGIHRKPKVVIVSGFENFKCAVEMLKYGARDYLLKPVREDDVTDVMRRMESEINREKKRLHEIDMIYRQHIRNLLLDEKDTEEEAWEILHGMFAGESDGCPPFRLVLMNPADKVFPAKAIYELDRVQGKLCFVAAEDVSEWKRKQDRELSRGISLVHTTVCEIPAAYKEALRARKLAFVHASETEVFSAGEESEQHDFSAETEQFLRRFPTEKMEEAWSELKQKCRDKGSEGADSIEAADLLIQLAGEMKKHYSCIFSKKNGGWDYPEPLDSVSLDSYLKTLERWMRACREELNVQGKEMQKSDKISQAIEYIQQNYQKDLNLAMVSNYISMNYSMFSNTFKKETGVNFVNYLKNIRIAEAKKLLEETDSKVAEVGAQVGYTNDKHFMKTFKALCGVSPSEYRYSLEHSGHRARN